LDQQSYRKLISGEDKSLQAVTACFLLSLLSGPYKVCINVRNFFYTKGWFRSRVVNATVISIGNITTGGTGKTPLVIRLCQFLRKHNLRTAILTRGYKTGKGRLSDEPAILTKNCPDTRVVVNPDRLAGAYEAITKYDAEVLVLDDGFQHRRLKRDLDIVTIDATCPFGYGRLLPAGLLREPVWALRRAKAAVITRCESAEENEIHSIENKLRLINPDITIAKSVHKPVCARTRKAGEIKLEELKEKKVFAFCGIARPEAFFRTIQELGVKVVGENVFNDHYQYTNESLDNIYQLSSSSGAEMILTTEKDWNKTALLIPEKDITFAFLVIELQIFEGLEKLTGLIEDTLAGKIQRNGKDQRTNV